MKYRAFIEDNFLIDEPKAGKLVPFKFNPVQILYYNQLCKDYDIENKGIAIAVRELIVKARREGFSSLILAIFAADDILQENPTETQVVSYKDDATKTFRRRYRRFILSWYAQRAGMPVEEIQANASKLDKFARVAFSTDSTDLVLRHNQAHFYCGTAAARTGGRGGVLQKLLFSEAAHYPDTENMTASETIEGTAQQVDKESGWIFQESTGNGTGNLFYKTVQLCLKKLSRYMLRFYGWRDFYTPAQFEVIKAEFTDPDTLKQEYPETIEEAFLARHLTFLSPSELDALQDLKTCDKDIVLQVEIGGDNYIDQCETFKNSVEFWVKTHPNRALYIGLDTAKSIDKSVLTLLQSRDLTPNGGVKCLAVDATGQDFVADWFERNCSSWFLVRVKFSRPIKSVMYKSMRAIITKKLTSIPVLKVSETEFVSEEAKHFYMQMTGLQKEVIGDMLVVAHPPGQCNPTNHDYDNCPHHDDYPDSWTLAEYAYIMVNGVPTFDRPPAESSSYGGAVRRLLDKGKANRGGHGNDDAVDNL